ncbi:MAG: YceI family protein [Melioribacteraceae bacterium]|jgi:polyisoprenoid-binding protein YceI|nr:YceI family protein [Melioribacteraceae bacterium]
MKNIYALLFMVIFTFTAFTTTTAQTKWNIDKSHSKIGFSVSHMVITDVEGNFKDFDASVTTMGDDFSTAKIDFTAKTASVYTENDKRDNHLRSDDFFNAEKYPNLTFKSKSIKKVSDNKYKLTGDLTMRDVTKEVVLDVKFNGIVTDMGGNTKAGFKITGELNRQDYGLKFNALLGTGDAVVGNTVDLDINIQLAKSK